MTAQIVHTEHGRMLLLPDSIELPAGPVDLLLAGPNTILVTADPFRETETIDGYFDGPYEDNGLGEPVDYPPEPVPQF